MGTVIKKGSVTGGTPVKAKVVNYNSLSSLAKSVVDSSNASRSSSSGSSSSSSSSPAITTKGGATLIPKTVSGKTAEGNQIIVTSDGQVTIVDTKGVIIEQYQADPAQAKTLVETQTAELETIRKANLVAATSSEPKLDWEVKALFQGTHSAATIDKSIDYSRPELIQQEATRIMIEPAKIYPSAEPYKKPEPNILTTSPSSFVATTNALGVQAKLNQESAEILKGTEFERRAENLIEYEKGLQSRQEKLSKTWFGVIPTTKSPDERTGFVGGVVGVSQQLSQFVSPQAPAAMLDTLTLTAGKTTLFAQGLIQKETRLQTKWEMTDIKGQTAFAEALLPVKTSTPFKSGGKKSFNVSGTVNLMTAVGGAYLIAKPIYMKGSTKFVGEVSEIPTITTDKSIFQSAKIKGKIVTTEPSIINLVKGKEFFKAKEFKIEGSRETESFLEGERLLIKGIEELKIQALKNAKPIGKVTTIQGKILGESKKVGTFKQEPIEVIDEHGTLQVSVPEHAPIYKTQLTTESFTKIGKGKWVENEISFDTFLSKQKSNVPLQFDVIGLKGKQTFTEIKIPRTVEVTKIKYLSAQEYANKLIGEGKLDLTTNKYLNGDFGEISPATKTSRALIQLDKYLPSNEFYYDVKHLFLVKKEGRLKYNLKSDSITGNEYWDYGNVKGRLPDFKGQEILAFATKKSILTHELLHYKYPNFSEGAIRTIEGSTNPKTMFPITVKETVTIYDKLMVPKVKETTSFFASKVQQVPIRLPSGVEVINLPSTTMDATLSAFKSSTISVSGKKGINEFFRGYTREPNFKVEESAGEIYKKQNTKQKSGKVGHPFEYLRGEPERKPATSSKEYKNTFASDQVSKVITEQKKVEESASEIYKKQNTKQKSGKVGHPFEYLRGEPERKPATSSKEYKNTFASDQVSKVITEQKKVEESASEIYKKQNTKQKSGKVGHPFEYLRGEPERKPATSSKEYKNTFASDQVSKVITEQKKVEAPRLAAPSLMQSIYTIQDEVAGVRGKMFAAFPQVKTTPSLKQEQERIQTLKPSLSTVQATQLDVVPIQKPSTLIYPQQGLEELKPTQIIKPSTLPATDLKISPVEFTKTVQKSEIIPILKPLQEPLQKPIQDIIIEPILKPTIKPYYVTPSTAGSAVPTITVPPPPLIFIPPSLRAGRAPRGRTGWQRIKQSRKYVPSLIARELNIVGKMPKGKLSGLEIRPLIRAIKRKHNGRKSRKLRTVSVRSR